jgi:serine/threonine protein kinase
MDLIEKLSFLILLKATERTFGVWVALLLVKNALLLLTFAVMVFNYIFFSEMFTGKLPWHPFKDENIIYLVHIKQTQQKPTYPPDLIEEAVDFLNCCLEFEPEKRSTADRLLDHPFVKINE